MFQWSMNHYQWSARNPNENVIVVVVVVASADFNVDVEQQFTR